MTDINARLAKLKGVLEQGHMSPEEFDDRRKALLDEEFRAGGAPQPSHSPQGTVLFLTEGMEIGPDTKRLFRLDKKLGGGAMGEVWKAEDLAESEIVRHPVWVAVKALLPLLAASERHRAALKREAINAKKLGHNNIIRTYDWYEDKMAGFPFLVMEYLEGQTLDRKFTQAGRLTYLEVLGILNPIVDALSHAWEDHRIVHRDLKPENIYLTADGKLKLLDFGIAAQVRETANSAGLVGFDSPGTLGYAPPEAGTNQKPTPRLDIYALGVITYELLEGEMPFTGPRTREHWPDKPETINEGQWQVLRRAMAYDADGRYDSARDYLAELRQAEGPSAEEIERQQQEEAAKTAAAKDARRKAEEWARLKAEAEAEATLKAEATAKQVALTKAKQEAEEKSKQAALTKAKQEAEEKTRQEALAKAEPAPERRIGILVYANRGRGGHPDYQLLLTKKGRFWTFPTATVESDSDLSAKAELFAGRLIGGEVTVECLVSNETYVRPEWEQGTDPMNFQIEVVEESQRQPVMLYFLQPKIDPVQRSLMNCLRRVVVARQGNVKIVTMDFEDGAEIAGRLKVYSAPAVALFVRGRLVGKFSGSETISEIDTALKAAGLPPPQGEPVVGRIAATYFFVRSRFMDAREIRAKHGGDSFEWFALPKLLDIDIADRDIPTITKATEYLLSEVEVGRDWTKTSMPNAQGELRRIATFLRWIVTETFRETLDGDVLRVGIFLIFVFVVLPILFSKAASPEPSKSAITKDRGLVAPSSVAVPTVPTPTPVAKANSAQVPVTKP